MGFSAVQRFFLLWLADFDDCIHENARGDDRFRINPASVDGLADLHDSLRGSHGHDRREVAGGHTVGQVAMGIANLCLDQGEVGFQPALLHIGAAIEFGDRLALGEIRAVAGRGVKCRNACTTRADAFGQGALGDEFQLDFTRQVALGENARVGGAREGADHLGDEALLNQGSDANMAVAGVVVDDGQVLWAAGGKEPVNEGVHQLDRRARTAETTDHDRRAIGNICHGFVQRGDAFVHEVLHGFDERTLIPGRSISKEFVRILTFVFIVKNSVRMLNKTDFIGSLAKGLKVIEAFRAERPKLAISDVSEITGLDRATARRCLLTLHELGYAAYDGKFFTLTPRIMRLGMGALAALPLAQMVQPWLDQLSEQIGQSTSVSILDDNEIVYIARAVQRRVMSIGLMPGSRLPAHCTSMGRVLLSGMPEADARALVESSDLTPRTAYSLTDPEEIIVRIRQVRETGFAVIDQEVEAGLRSIAVPLYGSSGRMVAALNTGVAAVQAEACDLITLYLPALLKVQDGLRRVLR